MNRTVGTMLGHEVTKRYGGHGLPDDTIEITFTGSAGQSFGAFVPKGITLRLAGDANDYVGKGLSGGRIVVRPPDDRHPDFVAEDNIIAGNVILYGATGGEVFLRGVVGERFCVRNSGAMAVVEGVGDHGCEYMTGGRVVVLGPTGRNFGAGMSGGIAYVYDPDDIFHRELNPDMVDLEPLEEDDQAWLRDIVVRHLRRDRLARRRTAPGRLARARSPLPQGHAQGLQAGARGGAGRGAGPRRRGGHHGGRPRLTRPTTATTTRRATTWVTPEGFLKHRDGSCRSPPAGRPSACTTGTRSTSPSPMTTLQTQASRCMDCGIPFCNNGCPLGNLIPDWNDLVYRDHWQRGDRAAARHQQLPGVHRAAVPGAVRGGLRARHQPAPGHHQAGRGRDHRPGLGRGLGHARAARRARPARRSPSSARARPGWPPPSS